ncbi:transposase [Streptomyces sp. NPDC005480]|uniref:transposase n=1 Tax=Streptomyces sp. NPDC005480 TaxID=3154880 RepID=UPI0033BBD25B
MAEKRCRVDAEFREGAVRIVAETGRPVAEVARELGINEGTLRTWISRAKQAGGDGTPADADRRARREGQPPAAAGGTTVTTEQTTPGTEHRAGLRRRRARADRSATTGLRPWCTGTSGRRGPSAEFGLLAGQAEAAAGALESGRSGTSGQADAGELFTSGALAVRVGRLFRVQGFKGGPAPVAPGRARPGELAAGLVRAVHQPTEEVRVPGGVGGRAAHRVVPGVRVQPQERGVTVTIAGARVAGGLITARRRTV